MEDGSHLQELLEALEAGVLSLDRDQGSDPAAAIHRLFQSAHNLKSGLAMAGLERASKLFHGLEDGLDDIRRGRLAWSAAWADAVLDTVDRVRGCLDYGHDGDLDPRFQPPGPETSSGGGVALSAEESVAAVKATALSLGLYRIEKLFVPGLTREEFEGHLILEDIQDSGTLISVVPGWEGYAGATEPSVVRYLFTSSQSAEKLSELFFDPLISLVNPSIRLRLLVVDDDRVTSKILQKAIEGLGEVVLAADGAEGLVLFKQAFDKGERFDVVVLDLEMPEVDGHGALQGFRDYEESHGVYGLDRCLVYMNTSNPDLKKVKASFRLQADRYFLKPLSVDQIKKRLEETLPWLETRRRGTT
jgi:two-component system chemotaxis response regulator CheY